MIDRDLSHPYDRGYWAAYDGKPRPADPAEHEGYDNCRRELSAEAWDRWDKVMNQRPGQSAMVDARHKSTTI